MRSWLLLSLLVATVVFTAAEAPLEDVDLESEMIETPVEDQEISQSDVEEIDDPEVQELLQDAQHCEKVSKSHRKTCKRCKRLARSQARCAKPKPSRGPCGRGKCSSCKAIGVLRRIIAAKGIYKIVHTRRAIKKLKRKYRRVSKHYWWAKKRPSRRLLPASVKEWIIPSVRKLYLKGNRRAIRKAERRAWKYLGRAKRMNSRDRRRNKHRLSRRGRRRSRLTRRRKRRVRVRAKPKGRPRRPRKSRARPKNPRPKARKRKPRRKNTNTKRPKKSSKVQSFKRYSMQGQMLAEATCTALNSRGGWTYAVPRVCNGGPSCSSVCATLGRKGKMPQAGRIISAFRALHIYGNQAARSVGRIGLKVHKYTTVRSRGCGPNYCCCRNGRSRAEEEEEDVEEDDEDLEEEEEEATGEPENLDEDVDTTEEDLEEGANPMSDIQKTKYWGWNRHAQEGQMLAQAACVAMHRGGGWVFAVRRTCSGRAATCAQACARAKDIQAKRIRCFNSLHLYANQPTKAKANTGMKTYRYNSCGGGCGPNFCCCVGTNAREDEAEATEDLGEAADVSEALDTLAAIADDRAAGAEDDDEEDIEAEEEETQEVGKFEQTGLDAQLVAEAACTSMAPNRKSGWTYAVRRQCAGRETCDTLCKKKNESQAKSEGKNNRLYCLNSLHIYGQQPTSQPYRIGLRTYKYNSCRASGCGPNYCCCWAGYNTRP
mmetsp:Transcript_18792/g.29137  ORF Transcript_18792/g.29137 Transcript_18792/m.29137 type:complete len:712 (-) Transcript_18792:47-2182(-)